MILKVISGGQIGADIAGLRAARACGIETGGTAPLGWRTSYGPNPSLETYGLVQSWTRQYPPRTRENARNSDGTMRFAMNWNSPGERATLRECLAADKPMFDVNIEQVENVLVLTPSVYEAKQWVIDNEIRILNIAGNGFARIEQVVETYVRQLIEP